MRKQAIKKIARAPESVRLLFDELVDDLQRSGPVRADWPNYSKLSDQTHHCHLNYSYVAVWRHEKGSIIIEVSYAGSREDAPY